jgi:hypothetical protein
VEYYNIDGLSKPISGILDIFMDQKCVMGLPDSLEN